MIKGYKVFNPDWTCRGHAYKVGEIYEIKGNIEICSRGFHFCENPINCFNYYAFNPDNKVAEIVAHGKVISEGDKSCTDKIEIVREVAWDEVLRLVNVGLNNTGLGNTGHYNTGNYNTGGRNTGNYNTGHYNTGHCNTGGRNTGRRNTGDYNTGHYNTGDFNLADHETGCFCTKEHMIKIFDKDSGLTYEQWRATDACRLLTKIELCPTLWVQAQAMTDKEKIEHPEYKTIGGYLKINDTTGAYDKWWRDLSDKEKEIIKAIPNFDAAKFKLITGIEA